MMKLILSLTLIWTLSSTAEALQCWIGEGTHRVSHTCNSAELCATVAIQVNEDGNLKKSTKRECVPSSLYSVGNHIFSYNVGFRATAEFIHVCNTDGCNSQDIPYSPDLKENELQCFTCDDLLSDVCNKTVQCVGEQDRCISGTVEYIKGKTAHVFGCASANFCEAAPRLEFRLTFKFHRAPKCCKTSLCNSAWSVKLNMIPLLFGLFTLIVY